MQTKTWTLTMRNGESYPELSQRDAARALDRVIHGLEPFEPQPIAAQQRFDNGHELPLAA
ncbi:MAG: hypothetical protein ACYCU0_15535 [Solirubrobacteraceae bacterium]